MQQKIKECGVMDSRFKNLDSELNFEPNKGQMKSFFEEFDDMMLDDAFREAAQSDKYPYSSSYWSSFLLQESVLTQNESFSSAALDYNTSYNPAYWNQAQQALVNEGLHYQYKPAYWSEAEKLLTKVDKRFFIAKWTGFATIILFVGLIAGYLSNDKSLRGINGLTVAKVKNFEKTAKKIKFNEQLRFHYKNETTDVVSSSDVAKPVNLAKNVDILYLKEKSAANNLAEVKIESEGQLLNHDISQNTSINSETLNVKNNSLNLPVDISGLATKAKNERNKSAEIWKINSAPLHQISQNFSIENPEPINDIQLDNPQIRKPVSFYLVPQIGIGNSFHNPKDYSYRLGIDFEAQFQRKNLSYSLSTGFDYENIDNYLYKSYIRVYDRSGESPLLGTDFSILNTVNWQNSFLIGYQLSKSFVLKAGLSYDMYVGTVATMQNKRGEKLIPTDSKYMIGRNDEFTNHNLNIISKLEFRLNRKIILTASGEFGLSNKLNSKNYPLLLPNKNRCLFFGLKYVLF